MADLAEYPEGSGEYYVDVRGDWVRVRVREEGEEEFGAWSGAGRGPTGEENGGQCRHRSDSTFNSSKIMTFPIKNLRNRKEINANQ